MPLASTRDLLCAARTAGYGIAAFNVIGLEHAEGIVTGAEKAQAPVILQLSANSVAYHDGAIEPIGRACAAIARRAAVPVALHLDHARSEELCERAVSCGFSSVMLDTSDLPYDTNEARTRDLVAWARDRGVSVEAGLGIVGGKDGATSSAETMTDAEMARKFMADTGADSLAVAIGTSHAMSEQSAAIDFDRLAEIRARVDVPLVLHGSSGVPDDDLARAVQRGITKVNLATQLNIAFTAAVRDVLKQHPDLTDPRRYLGPARQALAEIVADRLRLIGAGGRA
jgi:fructose-bisphosphate aldolase class II